MQLNRWILISLLFFFSSTVFADVTQFVFATEPQSVPVDTLSSIITVQSQDSSGIKENIANTMYVTITSSSATGNFFTNTTGGVWTNPVTMAKNSANKNFYYSDGISGTHTIQVSVSSEKGGPVIFSTNQNIFVGVPTSGNTSGVSSTTTQTTPSSNQTDDSYSVTSAHSSPASLSQGVEKLEFEISAGRDRLTEVGSSVAFRAVPTKFDKIPESGITYVWSFGDGTISQGNNINHTYKFAGDYTVVVNASYSDKQAVSRTQVRVISPSVSLTRVSGGVEVINKSNVEINLEGWSLVGNPSTRAELGTGQGKKIFIFPKDTLIPSGKKVIFADEVTGMSDSDTQLLNPIGKEFAGFVLETPTMITAQTATTTLVNLDDIQARLNDAKNKLAQISPITLPKPQVAKIVVIASPPVSEPIPVASTSTPDIGVNTAVVFEASQKSGFVSSIFSWPIKGFNFIRHLFTEE